MRNGIFCLMKFFILQQLADVAKCNETEIKETP